MARDAKFLSFIAGKNDLEPDLFFDTTEEAFVASHIVRLGEKYGKAPFDMLMGELERTRSKWPVEIEADPSTLKEVIRYAYTAKIEDIEYIKDTVEEEIGVRRYNTALSQCVALLEDHDLNGVREVLREAEKHSSLELFKSPGTTLEDIPGLISEHAETLKAGAVGIPTGIEGLDASLPWKGLGRKELSLVLAPAKRGKTMFMLWCAYSAICAGRNVTYISLEVSELVLALRLVACNTQHSIDLIMNHPKKYIGQFSQWVKKNKPGSIKFLERPSKSLTASGIRNIVRNEIDEGRAPDLVVVDYAKLMKHSAPGWEGLGETVEELRGVAGEFNLAMLSGAQGNRESINKAVPGHGDIGYDFSQVQTADLIISLGRRGDIQFDMDGNPLPLAMRIHVIPSRNCFEFSVEIITQYAHGRMYCGES